MIYLPNKKNNKTGVPTMMDIVSPEHSRQESFFIIILNKQN